VGYRIEILDEDENVVYRIGYATDIGYVTLEIEEGLSGCDAVILESNHDYDMLMTGPYPYDLKKRIASRRGHLSNPDSAALAARLCAAGTKKLMLAHLSQENNAPDLAYDECVGAVGDAEVQIFVAHPEIPTEML
jgi:phosphoribosyl 1,2-cyclic phosphodiesterase